jgi:hypothetical protein
LDIILRAKVAPPARAAIGTSKIRRYAADRANRAADETDEGAARARARAITAEDAAAQTAAGARSVQSGLAQDPADAGTESVHEHVRESVEATMSHQELRDEINKRLTLNWLIQGASQHAGSTLHYLVRDELNAIDPQLIRLYDQFALIALLQYWHTDAMVLVGRPGRFWTRAKSDPTHPFFGHPLLARHGGMLAVAAKERALERCKIKGVTRLPVLFSFQALRIVSSLRRRESRHRFGLTELAKRAAHLAWGIPTERMDAELTQRVEFGVLSKPRKFRNTVLRLAAVGYGGVIRRDESLVVTAKAVNWLLLAKELVKGTAELICMHGLNTMSDDEYGRVMQQTDLLEYEPWMIQTGGELWRRVLELIPHDRSVANVLMHLARLPPKSLETLMLAVIEQPEWARELIAALSETHAQQETD